MTHKKQWKNVRRSSCKLACTTIAILMVGGLLAAGMAFPARALDNNLQFNGTLVSDPCDLDPQTTDITLDFGEVVQKYLYINTRTNSKPLTINLINCDITLGNSVAVTFTGPEDAELPGMLAVSGSATGIAIGLENQDGTPLPFNQAVTPLPVNTGTTSLTFGAYIQGEPNAISGRSIVPGTVSATATFELAYP
ncbi:fimbrial protein [Enterobacter sichuanensis]|uniref:fimbrial protein n=1 Tax=Enterobacter sichuanensis TaxID=2071710 RepID=UPI00217F037D|nr:fimbrial protein [Enterobacter sichuanensis]WKW90268.1 Fimbria A protein [Enterobacter sichuanensis]